MPVTESARRAVGLSSLNFRNADLRGASFAYTRLDGSSFQGADLRAASFGDGNMWKSDQTPHVPDFTDSDLRHSYFSSELEFDVTLNGADTGSIHILVGV